MLAARMLHSTYHFHQVQSEDEEKLIHTSAGGEINATCSEVGGALQEVHHLATDQRNVFS
jgi:hypothetical protein